MGKKKVWSIEYADDIAVVAEEEERIRDMIRRLKGYLERKKLELSVEKSKIFRNKGVEKKRDFGGEGKE